MNKRGRFLALGVILFIFGLLFFSRSLFNNPKPQGDNNQPTKIQVAATIFPLYDIIRQVGQDRVEAVLILPPGASPHTFDPSPSDLRLISNSDLIFKIGAGSDDWASRLIADNKNNKEEVSKLVDLSSFLSLESVLNYEDEADHDHGDLDPHYWLDPIFAQEMAKIIALELARLDPSSSDYYLTNAENFRLQLEEKMIFWHKRLSNLPLRKIAVFHDAWYYFSRQFNLEIAASFEVFPGKTPSPQYLLDLQTKINDAGVKTLFIEPQLSSEAAQVLADDLGINVGILDPIGGLDNRDSYIKLIDYNIETIYGALFGSR